MLLRRLFLLCGALLLAWAAIEGLDRGLWAMQAKKANRVQIPQDSPSRDAYETSGEFYGRHDVAPQVEGNPYLGYRLRPSVQGDGYRTNNCGLRYDEDLQSPKPARELRVLVTGGSAAWGTGVVQEKVFERVAEDLLARSPALQGWKVRVINAGVPCYSSLQEWLWASTWLTSLQPDVVVMFTGWNDTYYGYRGADMFSRLEVNGLADVVPRAPIPGIDPPQYENYASKLRFRLDSALYRLQATPNALRERIRAHELPPAQVLEKLAGNLKRMQTLCRGMGSAFVFVLQPTLYATAHNLSEYEQGLVTWGENQLLDYPRYNADLYALYRKELPGLGLAMHDADLALAAEPKTVFVDQVHFGDRGNRLLGEHLSQLLLPVLRQRISAARGS